MHSNVYISKLAIAHIDDDDDYGDDLHHRDKTYCLVRELEEENLERLI